MISLYIHIPFCEKKCSYCSFLVNPMEKFDENKKNNFVNTYLSSLKKEISFRAESLKQKFGKKIAINSIYFGGGTPTYIGKNKLIELIEFLGENFDLESLAELNIEMNPFPIEENLELIKSIQEKFNFFPRIRRSIGLQTFDPKILQESGRFYNFPVIAEFLRNLQSLKQINSVFNFDFIAFGKQLFNSQKYGLIPRRENQREFFLKFINSGFPDSFSIYMLEISKGSQIYADQKLGKIKIDEEKILQEFQILKEEIQFAGFTRYEISNFASISKIPVHNMVYRKMESYLGLGIGASSYLKFEGEYGKRFSNTKFWYKYNNQNRIDQNSEEFLSRKEYLKEKFFLGIRTFEGVNISEVEEILVSNWKEKVQELESEGLIKVSGEKLILTDEGMDLENQIIGEFLI